jgi:hypothetical protein
MPIERLTRAGATSVLGAREFVHPQDAWPAEEHSDTFCHRALGAPKGLFNTGEVLPSVCDPQHLCHVQLMRSASAEGGHLQDGVPDGAEVSSGLPLPSSSPGSSLSGEGSRAEPRSCGLRLEVGAVDHMRWRITASLGPTTRSS